MPAGEGEAIDTGLPPLPGVFGARSASACGPRAVLMAATVRPPLLPSPLLPAFTASGAPCFSTVPLLRALLGSGRAPPALPGC